jgi:hypothetical protein
MTARTPISLRSLVGLLVAGALLLAALMPGDAHASVVGANGQITGCYAKKGKAKGTLRVVPSGRRCRKGEKPVTWNAQGQSGQNGPSGSSSQLDTLTSQVSSLTTQLSTLTSQLSTLQTDVGQLEGVLSGVTNTDLLNAVTNAAKLNGISASDLTGAIGAVPDVSALCTQMTSTVTQLNSIRTVISGLDLSSGLLGLGLGGLVIPSLPTALSPFTCP